MTKSKRKYLSEFAVNLCSKSWLMTSASQIMSGGAMGEREQEIANNSHIYLIVKRPIMSFSKHSFKYKDNVISGHINYRIDGDIREKEIEFDFPLVDGAVELKLSKYPHRELVTYDIKGNEVRYLPASAVAMKVNWHHHNEELKNLEIFYIGQAYGDGSRTAFDRLKAHSTFQKILAQAQYDSPDSEIQILTFEYAPYRVLTMMDGRAKDAISDYRDLDRFRDITNIPLTEYQQICLAEAALIRYFQPAYNHIYKDNFPHDKHKILESCYDLDFSALVVEINTDELGFSLYSDTVSPREHHICNIDILDPEERWGFFHYSKGDGSSFKMPNIIQRR